MRPPHEHHDDVVIVHRNYSHLPGDPDEDLMVIYRDCLASLGILSHGPQWLWDSDLYPYNPSAPRGHACYRPGPDWPPSWNEVRARWQSQQLLDSLADLLQQQGDYESPGAGAAFEAAEDPYFSDEGTG
jgi:hypothetical protein